MPSLDPQTIEPAVARRDWLRPLRYLLRVPLLLLHILVSLPVALLLIALPTASLRLRSGERVDHRAIRAWSAGLLRIFGFRLRRVGLPLQGATLFVANHVSWIDITLLHSQHAVGFVAKDRLVADLLPAIRTVLSGRSFVSPSVAL